MAEAFRQLLASPPEQQLSWEEKLGLLIDREWTDRENRRLARRLREAHLGVRASLEDVVCEPGRGIDKPQLRQLGSCQWVKAHQNVILLGPTGVGKSYLASALAEAACRRGARAFFMRVPRLTEELAVARASGAYGATLARFAKADVLVLDDFLLAPMKDSERRDLLEVLEDRYDKSSTIITSQLPTKTWHEALGDPTIADAICDRLVHNAHVVTLRGHSMRRRKGASQPATEVSTPNP
ncbi:MAG TPA: IS21-like element helper ATPase IstB [Polyangiaceae bacterium]|nr:IS21-like element helper ATPase IstB [Polyangiaceae bacterium]